MAVLMPSVRHVRHAFANAFTSYGFRQFGLRFAADYLRFAVRCARQWGHAGPGELKLLGARIAYPNQSYALFLLHEIFVKGTYAFRAPTSSPRVLDCGANVGFSVFFFKALYPSASVVAFEPEPTSCTWLRQNLVRNGLGDVEVRQQAIAGRDGTVTLHVPAEDAGSIVASIAPGSVPASGCVVEAVRLSSVLQDPVDFLKLDVEGAEYDVLEEAGASGALRQVREAAIEYHRVGSDGDPARLVATLAAAGMACDAPKLAGAAVGMIRARRC